MKNCNWLKVLYLPLFLSLSSCFQFIEEISLNPDGSGTVILTLNLSQSKTKLASIMLIDSIRGHNIPSEDEIRSYLKETVAYLKKSSGISNVKQSLDLENYIASIQFSFKEVSNINHLSENVLKKYKLGFSNPSTYSYLPANGVFMRKYVPVKKGSDEFSNLSEEDKNIFEQATFVNIFRFQKNIASFTNRNAKISPSKKAIMLQCSIKDLIHGNATITNQINLN